VGTEALLVWLDSLHLYSHYLTSKPSSRRHCLCNSISFWHSGSSSPFFTMHSSRGVLVSGQQQQIGFPVLMPSFFLGFSWVQWGKRRRKFIVRKTVKPNDSLVHSTIRARFSGHNWLADLVAVNTKRPTGDASGVDDPCPMALLFNNYEYKKQYEVQNEWQSDEKLWPAQSTSSPSAERRRSNHEERASRQVE